MHDRKRLPPAAWLAVGAMAAILASAVNLGPVALGLGWEAAFTAPDPADQTAVLFYYSQLPRLAISLLAGAALGLAGALLQQVLRNPLASPTTVGIEAGAQLALAVALAFFPVLLGWSRDLVTLSGGLAAMLCVFAVAWRFGFSPLVVMLAGLMIGLYANACVTILALTHDHYLEGLFIWGAGSLVQQDWRPVLELLPRVLACSVLVLLLMRPLELLQLDDAAKGLGVRIALVRTAGLGLAATLTAFVASTVGVIGFLGLAAPAVARLLGARRFHQRLVLAPLTGALLLTLTDQLLQLGETWTGVFVPTGAVTAVLGAPLLLVLVRRLPATASSLTANPMPPLRRAASPARLLGGIIVLTGAVAVLAILVGRNIDGALVFVPLPDLELLLPWRLPRTLVAISGGIMLAIAGVFLQRLTANPIASPEVLGISSGAAFGVLAALFISEAPGYALQALSATAGALAVFLVLMALERRSGGCGERLLYSGVAVGALLTAVLAAIIATGDPRARLLLQWMTGSTYLSDWRTAWTLSAIAALALCAAPLFTRPLTLLSLGDVSARATGVNVRLVRLSMLVFTCTLTAVATLAIGPLSFVGLMAPHLARRAGLVGTLPQILGAAMLGALVMTIADYAGRIVWFPWQLPAGIVATLVGGPVLVIFLLRRQGKAA